MKFGEMRFELVNCRCYEQKTISNRSHRRAGELLKLVLPLAKRRGRERTVDFCEMINPSLYLLRAGCSWRMLPHDFPAWETVYGYFRQWRDTMLFEKINDILRVAVRESEEREDPPSSAIIDSQSIKTTEQVVIVVTT